MPWLIYDAPLRPSLFAPSLRPWQLLIMNGSDCVKCQSLAYQQTVPLTKLMLTNDWEHKEFEHTINL